MNAKKIMLFGLLLTAVSLQALGQQRGDGNRRGRQGSERMVEAMKERLDLSDDQVTKLKAIYKESAEEFRKMREDNAEANRGQREEFRKMREKQEEKVNEILTKEQQEKLKAWREERQSQQRRRPRPEQQRE